MSTTLDIEDAVDEAVSKWDSFEFRQYQKEAIVELVRAFKVEDKDVVLINAPTGSGKSLIIHIAEQALRLLDTEESDSGGFSLDLQSSMDGSSIPEALGEGAFITTPLNALVDQLGDDGLISPDVTTLKGRNNYECIHPEDEGNTVDSAICQRDDSFECEMKSECPYYSRKYKALQHDEVVTNMSYIMAEGMIGPGVKGTFKNRDRLYVDECQGVEDFAMNFISFTVSSRTVPQNVWDQIDLPDEKYEGDMNHLVNWLRDEVLSAVSHEMDRLDSIPMQSEHQNEEFEKLRQFSGRVENFIEDVENNEWVAQKEVNVRKNRSNEYKWVFKPIKIGRFLTDLLWERADKIVLSSATIPSGNWLSEIGLIGDEGTSLGLNHDDIKHVKVPSTFPVENRPIIADHAVGKMTKDEREQNMFPMAMMIKRIAEHHEGEKGFVHCRSYKLAENLKRSYVNNGERKWAEDNVMLQDRYNREESLEKWQNSDKQVFFSVAMDEGVDLEGDKCRWQVLAKTLYKHMGDKRTRKRVLEMGDWDWYNRHAAIQLQQAYGRAVRGPEDEAVFYILDESAKKLIQMNADLFNSWFLEAIEDMSIDPNRGM